MRAAGDPHMNTVDDPMMIVSGGPAQVAISPTFAAGRPAISTVGQPGGRIGPPTCGVPPGVTIGQICMSVILAAIPISVQLICTTEPLIVVLPEEITSELPDPSALN